MPAAKYAGRYRSYNQAYGVEARDEAKRLGLCVHCRTRDPKPGCVTCVDCLMSHATNRDAAIARGLCGMCRKQEPKPGCVTCVDCIEAACESRRQRTVRKRRAHEQRQKETTDA